MFKFRYVILCICVFLMSSHLYAQMSLDDVRNTMSGNALFKPDVKDTSWGFKKYGSFNFGLNQIAFINWLAGGTNSTTILPYLNFYTRYTDSLRKKIWENYLILAYGWLIQQNVPNQKADDNIQLLSKFGYKMKNPHWYYSMLISLKTQFYKGYDATGQRLISNTFAPAYLTVAPGIEYKPILNKNLTLFLSPITYRLLMVLDQSLANQGLAGVRPAEYAADGSLIRKGQRFSNQPGAYFRAFFYDSGFPIERVATTAQLELFSDYSNKPQNIAISLSFGMVLTLIKNLTLNFNLNVMYDDKMRTPIYNDEGVLIKKTPMIQLKESLVLNYKYIF